MRTPEHSWQILQEINGMFETGDLPEAIACHGADTRLADLPLECLPLALQETCEAFIDAWWATLDPDQPLQPSGLGDMTLAQLLAYHSHRKLVAEHRSGVASSSLSSAK